MGALGLTMLIFITATSLLLGSLVLLSDYKSRSNRWFAAIAVLIILWNFFAYLGYISTDALESLLFFRLNFMAVALFFIAVYRFTSYFPVVRKQNPIIDIPVIVTAILFAITSVVTNMVINDVRMPDPGTLIMEVGPLGNYFYIYTFLLTIYILYILIKESANTSKANQDKIRIFIIGTLIYATCNIVFSIGTSFLYKNNYNYTQLGDFSGIFFLGFTAYSIIKHHLFDVKLAIVRSVTYVFVLVSLACLYLDIVYIISGIFDKEVASPGQIATGVVTSLILAFVFQPLKQFFDKVTNKIFYKDNYNTDDFFTRVNESLTTTTDLRNLLEQISHEIGNTLKSEQTFFYINTDQDHHVSAGTQHHRQLPKADADKLGELCGKSGDIVIASMLEPEDEVRRLLLSHRIELILPLVESNKIIGYLCLGDHRSNSGYTNRDVKALNAVSDEIAIAIQNALAVQEIREFNSTLQQRIENATKELRASNSILRQLDKTKDEFVGMASHQLRTPLTSVKGYISMVLEGDAGKVSDMQRKFLEEAFMSSERMVRLIDDFLNVSRIQNGKFIIDKHEVDLSKVVEQEIDSLSPSAKMRNLKFVYKPATDVPTINIDEGKIRQVIMNFADNALYYSHDNTEIAINLSVEDGDIVFTVKDTGIGVPISEQAQLFSKFYRASNARKQRPDGTGVGLYLAKKVIDAHGGKVIFFSIEGKGSMFGFRIPIDQKVESTTAS